MFIGAGTAIDTVAILIGSLIGIGIGSRLPDRTRSIVTDVLGLVTGLVGVSAAASVASPALKAAVGSGMPVLIVLGALLIGGIIGSILNLESKLDGMGENLKRKFGGKQHTFVEGFVTASLLFVVGPLGILGSLSDGLGNGIDQLLLKSLLDFFAAIAFAGALGWGVAASALPILIYQGGWTAIGWGLGSVLSDFEIDALTATGGLMLVATALRLLKIKDVGVGNLLPALVVAPLLALLISKF